MTNTTTINVQAEYLFDPAILRMRRDVGASHTDEETGIIVVPNEEGAVLSASGLVDLNEDDFTSALADILDAFDRVLESLTFDEDLLALPDNPVRFGFVDIDAYLSSLLPKRDEQEPPTLVGSPT